jgi:V8-like Glu-specific endopeptidase
VPARPTPRAGGKPSAPAGTPTARHFGGLATVGPLFPPGATIHTCTASVVDSPARDLLLTAAHCITGSGKGYVFAPGYHDGVEPYGTWTVVAAYGVPSWIAHQAPQSDLAFLTVAPHQLHGKPQEIQDVTGADRLGSAPAPGARVTVPAYVLGSNDKPITCTAHVYDHAGYPAFNCHRYAAGTSGAPWIERTSHGSVVVGVIGGLHQGGCFSWTSYSANFTSTMLRSALRSASRGVTSSFPPAGSDGCPATGS